MNGSPDAVVRMRIAGGPIGTEECICRAAATAGELTLPMRDIGGGRLAFQLPPSDRAEVFVTVEPRKAQVQTFSAPGLTQGGRHEWGYEYRFLGLKIGLSQ